MTPKYKINDIIFFLGKSSTTTGLNICSSQIHKITITEYDIIYQAGGINNEVSEKNIIQTLSKETFQTCSDDALVGFFSENNIKIEDFEKSVEDFRNSKFEELKKELKKDLLTFIKKQ